jgi:hypothetical protein
LNFYLKEIIIKMKNIIKEAEKAYNKAFNSGHTEELQEIACKDPYYAYCFAMVVKGADIWYCQEAACKEPYWAYCFAKYVVGADIEYCQEWACKDPYWAYWFAVDVNGVDLEVCLEAVRGTEWEGDVRKIVIESGVG